MAVRGLPHILPKGQQLLADLTHLPTTPEAQTRYIQAARILDDFYTRLSRFYHDIFFPVVEGRQKLSSSAADALFGAELAEVAAEKPDVVGFSILTEHNLLYALVFLYLTASIFIYGAELNTVIGKLREEKAQVQPAE